MYEDLVKAIRQNTCHFDACGMCPKRNALCVDRMALQAADAIEELQKRVPQRPHGRLIDSDELTKEMRLIIKENMLSRDDARELLETIAEAPTVIEAEEAGQDARDGP